MSFHDIYSLKNRRNSPISDTPDINLQTSSFHRPFAAMTESTYLHLSRPFASCSVDETKAPSGPAAGVNNIRFRDAYTNRYESSHLLDPAALVELSASATVRTYRGGVLQGKPAAISHMAFAVQSANFDPPLSGTLIQSSDDRRLRVTLDWKGADGSVTDSLQAFATALLDGASAPKLVRQNIPDGDSAPLVRDNNLIGMPVAIPTSMAGMSVEIPLESSIGEGNTATFKFDIGGKNIGACTASNCPPRSSFLTRLPDDPSIQYTEGVTDRENLHLQIEPSTENINWKSVDGWVYLWSAEVTVDPDTDWKDVVGQSSSLG